MLLLPLELSAQFLETPRFGFADALELDVLRLRDGAVIARHDAVVRLADARPAAAAALAGALVLLGGAHVRRGAGDRGPPGGTAEAALAAIGGHCHVARGAAAAAQRRRRVGVRGAPRARQRVDTPTSSSAESDTASRRAVRRSPVQTQFISPILVLADAPTQSPWFVLLCS